ncbi:MAG: hypothetical protein HY094_07015 [Candidatus Melainabacteria bacterium]|nr:hypothetical protein [Candidatus Melainabacteria bacterium]
MNDPSQKLIKKSLLSNQALGAVLILTYCLVYGISAQYVLSGVQFMFFLSSLLFSLSIVYIRDPDRQKEKVRKGILLNQAVGTSLVFIYVLVYGISSITLLNSFQLIFFMSSYTFAMSLFYIRDPDRIKKAEENVSATITQSSYVEKYPCFISNKDLSWLVRDLNECLSTVIGFSELMLKRDFNEREKEYMIKSIYEKAVSMSGTVGKASAMVNDSPVKPKELGEANLLNGKALSK